MGQAVRKLKPPSRPVAPSEPAIPKPKRQSVDIKSTPPVPQIIIEPDQSIAGERPDPNFVFMSQKVVGTITTRSAGQKEHPTARISDEYTRPMPSDRRTTLRSGPDETSIQAPGKLNHAHIKELFLLHQGKADGQVKPLDVESLAKKFSVDVELLRRVLHHTTLVYYEQPVRSSTAQVPEKKVQQQQQQIIDTDRQLKGAEGWRVTKEPS